jgi:hypothetical protein
MLLNLWRAAILLSCLTVLPQTAVSQTAVPQADQPTAPQPETVPLRGQVVWLDEAFARQVGVEPDQDARQLQTALQSTTGDLLPLVKDGRGRGFWKDARLRNRDLELLVRRWPGLPLIQVIEVYSLHDDQRFLLDYWCDICAIPMYELKACECCQGEIRLRERPVDANGVEKPAADPAASPDQM